MVVEHEHGDLNRISYGHHQEGLSPAVSLLAIRAVCDIPTKCISPGFIKRSWMYRRSSEVNLDECFVVTLAKVSCVAALNCKSGRPIPPKFAIYDTTQNASDPKRDSLGYPTGWKSYHCELIDPGFPALMDDYWQAPDQVPEHSLHDRITRQFLSDRVRAKIAR